MSLQNSGGAPVATLRFQLMLPLDVAEQEIRVATSAVTDSSFSDLLSSPVYSKVSLTDLPIMILAATSDATPMTQVEDMVEAHVA